MSLPKKSKDAEFKVQRHKPKECPKNSEELLQLPRELEQPDYGYQNYYLRIVSDKKAAIEAKKGLYCQLIGKLGSSECFPILHESFLSIPFIEDMEGVVVTAYDSIMNKPSPATYSDMSIITNEEIGPLLGIAFYSDENNSGAYFVSIVIAAFQDSEPEVFPAYKWLQGGDEILVTSQTCTVVSEVVQSNPQLVELRNRQTAYYHKRYEWKTWGLGPSHYKVKPKSILEMPLDERFSYEKFADYGLSGLNEKLKEKARSLYTDDSKFSSFEDYAKILNDLYLQMEDFQNEFNPDILYGGRWMQDRELGRQMLDGINPNLIAKCMKLPTHFPVTDEMVKDSLRLSLRQEMEDGNVYIVGMVDLLEDLPCGNICPAPTGLFYVKPSGDLYPIAIQLEPNGVIFTPSDPYFDWLQAKMYFQCGNWQVHEVVHHALLTHFIAETFCVATKRNLPLAHPIYRLLNGHFVGTIFINAAARDVLVSPGGLIDANTAMGGNGAKGIVELAKRGYKEFSLLSLALPNDLDERQVRDEKKLPHFHYRDDGMLIWNAIEKMVTGIVGLFYKSDTDVADDPELQAWVKDLNQEGFPVRDGKDHKKKMPQVIESLDCLIAVCTTIIWVCSARHCAVNTGQFQMYAFAPNAPALVRKPIPKKKSGATLKDVLDTLPIAEKLHQQITTVWILSQYMAQSVLGYNKEVLFVEQEALDVLEQFRVDLKRVERLISDRNDKLEIPYKYLLPSTIVNSISI